MSKTEAEIRLNFRPGNRGTPNGHTTVCADSESPKIWLKS